MLSPQQRDLLCTQAGFGPNDYANVAILRRSVEGDPRVNQIRHTNWRLLAGLRGDLGPAWSYDVYGLRTQVSSPQQYVNDFDVDHLADALDVVGDPNDPSTWRCRSGNPGCAPWNVFQKGGVTPEVLDYLYTNALLQSGTRTQMLSATLRGDLERYGVVVPSASEGVQLALGAEYRHERLFNFPDQVFEKGAAGFEGGSPRIDGSFNVRELFVEALVPVVQDTRGAEDLSVELGYRYAHYNLSGGNSSYKTLLAWAPIKGLKLRTGFNRAVRAPNAQELFSPQAHYAGGKDICANDVATGVPSATLEQCLRTGVSESQYGRLPGPGGVDLLWGGTLNLDVEKADTLTAGFVWTPPSIPGLSATIDYYDIALEDAIGALEPDQILWTCANTGDPVVCGLIHRDSAGTLSLFGGYVDSTNQNIGRLGARGVDVSASYPLNLGRRGFVSFSLMGTYMLENSFSNRAIDYDCAGYYGNQCGQPNARWRHRVRASWHTKLDTTISLGWRFIGSATIDDASPDSDLANPDLVEEWKINGAYVVRAYSYLDLAATYSFRKGLQLTLGVNNLLDTEPPLAPGLNDNDYGPGFYGTYDPLGRTVYVSLQFDF
jgi:iron complex outermembrane receptor protein